MPQQTLIEKTRRGVTPVQVREVAREEGLEVDRVREEVSRGRVVIARAGRGAGGRAVGIGAGLRIKVNANLGTSHAHRSVAAEMKKLSAALEAGTDTVMDLSTGGNLDKIRRAIVDRSPVAVGTVPIYQAAVETLRRHPGRLDRMTPDQIFHIIEKQARDGIGFVTVHSGLTLESLGRVRLQGRVLGIVSRGGAFLAEWMILTGEENPLFAQYDRLLNIAARYDLILSLGDALRPGCLEDATDRGQVQELIVLGELTRRSWDAGVQVMIEGPGHMTMDQIQANVILEKKLCHGAPFYVLGPLVTDRAPGYDHITSAIGGALAAWAGADFLCYVTPSEHIGLPVPEEVRRGVVAARIAAHAADLARGRPASLEQDRRMARQRKTLNWKGQEQLSLDPTVLARRRRQGLLPEGEVCDMCGPYCSIKGMRDILRYSPRRGVKNAYGRASRGSDRKS